MDVWRVFKSLHGPRGALILHRCSGRALLTVGEFERLFALSLCLSVSLALAVVDGDGDGGEEGGDGEPGAAGGDPQGVLELHVGGRVLAEGQGGDAGGEAPQPLLRRQPGAPHRPGNRFPVIFLSSSPPNPYFFSRIV